MFRSAFNAVSNAIGGILNLTADSADWGSSAIREHQTRWKAGKSARDTEYAVSLEIRVREAQVELHKALNKFENQISKEDQTSLEEIIKERMKDWN